MERPRDALAEGTEIAGYVIGRVLGRGGFGITYLATDALHPDIKVAIKEFLPGGLAVREGASGTVHPASPADAEDFAHALARFQDEARTLVALRHPNIVDAQRFIKANGTAYVVMKYEEGHSLGSQLGRNKKLPETELRKILPPLLDGIEAVHTRQFLHRDIKPDNIYLRSADGSPVLIDFGAARQAMADDRKTSLTEIVTPGYAPYEQYDRYSKQGTYTDIYSLGATLYRCVTGQKPTDATARINAAARRTADPLTPARDAAKGSYSPRLLAAIDKALAVFETDRPQSIAELRTLLGLDAAAAPESAAGSTLNLGRKKAVPSAAAAPETSAVTVPPAPDRRRRRKAWAAAGLAGILIAGGSYFAWSHYRAGQERSVATARLEAEETARRKAEDEKARTEAEARRKAEEEARKRAADAETKRRAEEEAKKRAEEERARAEAETKRRAEEEAKKRAEEEAKRRAEQERERAAEEARRKAEEERKRAEEEREREQAEQRRRAEEEARRKAEEEREREEAERKRRAEEERQRAEEDERRRKIEPDWRVCTKQTSDEEDRQYEACSRLINVGLADADLAQVYAFRADAANVLQHFAQGLADSLEAIRLDPKLTWAHNAHGNALYGYKRYRDAIAAFGRAIEMEPSNGAAYFNRGRTWTALGDRASAIRDMREAGRLGISQANDALRRMGVTR